MQRRRAAAWIIGGEKWPHCANLPLATAPTPMAPAMHAIACRFRALIFALGHQSVVFPWDCLSAPSPSTRI